MAVVAGSKSHDAGRTTLPRLAKAPVWASSSISWPRLESATSTLGWSRGARRYTGRNGANDAAVISLISCVSRYPASLFSLL